MSRKRFESRADLCDLKREIRRLEVSELLVTLDANGLRDHGSLKIIRDRLFRYKVLASEPSAPLPWSICEDFKLPNSSPKYTYTELCWYNGTKDFDLRKLSHKVNSQYRDVVSNDFSKIIDDRSLDNKIPSAHISSSFSACGFEVVSLSKQNSTVVSDLVESSSDCTISCKQVDVSVPINSSECTLHFKNY